MPLEMGPVLAFRGCDDNNWNLTALVVATDDPGKLTAGPQTADPEALWQNGKRTAYRYTFAFPMTNQQTTAGQPQA